MATCSNNCGPAAHRGMGGGIDAIEPFCCKCANCPGGDDCEHANEYLRDLVLDLGEALATCIEELERRGWGPMSPTGGFAKLIVAARKEGR